MRGKAPQTRLGKDRIVKMVDEGMFKPLGAITVRKSVCSWGQRRPVG